MKYKYLTGQMSMRNCLFLFIFRPSFRSSHNAGRRSVKVEPLTVGYQEVQSKNAYEDGADNLICRTLRGYGVSSQTLRCIQTNNTPPAP